MRIGPRNRIVGGFATSSPDGIRVDQSAATVPASTTTLTLCYYGGKAPARESNRTEVLGMTLEVPSETRFKNGVIRNQLRVLLVEL